jgi:gluconokinase
MSKPATLIPGLRSPYEKVGGIVLFGRVLDKIRLHSKGQLPEDWVAAMGLQRGFDGRCVRFLHLEYAALEAETLKGGTDEEILGWAFAHGRKPTEEEIEIWNGFMMKYGWRDAAHERLLFRLDEAGLPADAAKTMFDFIELDEGRTAHGD